jgi:4-amino-4-deoxy-L-arabinose transferase-like glycosyltransferase
MNKKQLILLGLLFLFSLFIRIYDLSKSPPALFSDEVDLGYQAFSFLKTGSDYFGNKFPISFHSFSDYRAPFYIYSVVPFVAIFGLNEISVRLPAVIFSILGIFYFYLIMKKISKNFLFSYLSSILLSICPWYFHYSRAGFEATCVFFLMCAGFYYFLEFYTEKKFVKLIFSIIFLSLSFYAYATARMLVPFLGAGIFFVYKKEIFNLGLKKISILILLTSILLSFFVVDMLKGGSIHRFSYLNIFSDSNLKFEIDRQRLLDTISNKEQTVGMKPIFSSLIFHNKPLSWINTIINNYFSALSSNFLFLSGDQNMRHNFPKTGQLYLIYFPLLLIGLFFSIKQLIEKTKNNLLSVDNKILLCFLFWLILSPIPSSITYDGGGHATRLFLMLPPLIFFVSYGLYNFINFGFVKKYKIFKVIIVLIILSESINYFHKYFVHYPIISGDFWHYGLKQTMFEIKNRESQYDEVYISDSFEKSFMFFLFWTKYDPSGFSLNNLKDATNNEFEGKKFGKYYFGKIIPDKFFSKEKKEKNILVFSLRNEFGRDLKTSKFYNFSTILSINDKEGNPKFYFLSNK